MVNPKKEVKISPVKGRPLLHWVGKKPLGVVRHFPAQLREKTGAFEPPQEPNYRAFMDARNGGNLLMHGDNMEILSTLLVGGFRHKVDLIYIDPPFASGADYVRTVMLRGHSEKTTGEEASIAEQVQYEDIWANDNYLQFMYERLILLRELLSERGSIYLHCDWRMSGYLRLVMDEVFGADNFINEIIWGYKTGGIPESTGFSKKHDHIFLYARGETPIFNRLLQKSYAPTLPEPHTDSGKRLGVLRDSVCELCDHGTPGQKYRMVIARDIWDDISSIFRNDMQTTGFPTQKPEALLERIIKASSDDDSIVLDCFCGSGTTAAVAQRLGRRWIAADMNRGAIQTTTKRLGEILSAENKNGGELSAKMRGFAHYRVNNYDFQNEHLLRAAVVHTKGVQLDPKDSFFDGVLQGELVKIAKFNNPLTKADVGLIKNELRNRPDEERDIVLIGNGSETGLAAAVEKAQKRRPVNKIRIMDIQRDGMFTFSPAAADVQIVKRGKKASVKIAEYISPSIMARMNADAGVFAKKIGDFRAQIDRVLWDSDYDGECFDIVGGDSPAKKTDLILGEYDIKLPRTGAKVAVKIVDMLGEETIIVK